MALSVTINSLGPTLISRRATVRRTWWNNSCQLITFLIADRPCDSVLTWGAPTGWRIVNFQTIFILSHFEIIMRCKRLEAIFKYCSMKRGMEILDWQFVIQSFCCTWFCSHMWFRYHPNVTLKGSAHVVGNTKSWRPNNPKQGRKFMTVWSSW